MNLVSEDGSLNSFRWKLNGNNYRLKATSRGLEWKVWSGVDEYINETDGSLGSYTRRGMSEQFKNVELIT